MSIVRNTQNKMTVRANPNLDINDVKLPFLLHKLGLEHTFNT